MTIPEHIQQLTSPRLSFELLPPVKGTSINTIFNNLDELVVFDPPYINITYHREEVSYVKHADGSLVPAVVRKRPGTVGIAAAIQARYKIDVVPHIICGGFSKQETEDALIDLDFLGIRNLLVLRGDGDKITGRFRSNPRGHQYASDLLEQIIQMNNGIYLDDYIENPNHTNFSIGVAGYPEKHQEAPNLETDLLYLKQKVDKGAEYIVTQMFFDNEVFYSFVNKCREIGITVPIIPGIKPISVKDHLHMLPRFFSISLPQALTTEVLKCSNNAQVKQVGVEWTTQQIKDLFEKGFPIAHVYTMGKADNIIDIARNCL